MEVGCGSGVVYVMYKCMYESGGIIFLFPFLCVHVGIEVEVCMYTMYTYMHGSACGGCGSGGLCYVHMFMYVCIHLYLYICMYRCSHTQTH